jgi:hypothetical protein
MHALTRLIMDCRIRSEMPVDWRGQRAVQTPDMEELTVMQVSARDKRGRVTCFAHEQLRHPYHLQSVQSVMPADFAFLSFISSLTDEQISVETASPVFTTNTSGQRRILMV